MARRIKTTIIGLTTFGQELALRLAKGGAEVLALDSDPKEVQAIASEVADARVVDARDIETLREIGVPESDLVVVGIRERFEMSVLIVNALQELKVPRIFALAMGKDEARVLEKLGVHRVIFPERDIAQRMAGVILNPKIHEYFELSKSYSVVEIEPPDHWIGKTLMGLGIRKHYGVLVVAVRPAIAAPDELIVPNPDYQFNPKDRIIVVGQNERINSMTRESA